MMRNAMNPSASIEFTRMGMGIDIRDVLAAVNVPTLILHRTDDQVSRGERSLHGVAHPGCEVRGAPGQRPRPVGERRQRHPG